MKARLLKTLLNNTKYRVADWDTFIAVGSPLCHNLIAVDKETLALTYALDTFKKGRAALDSSKDELLFIWDTLQSLIDSGQIQDIINGQDTIENPLPVFTYKDGQIIETSTDTYGWPNVTIDGKEMDGDHFPTKDEAIERAVRHYENRIENLEIDREEMARRLADIDRQIEQNSKYLSSMNKEPVLA